LALKRRRRPSSLSWRRWPSPTGSATSIDNKFINAAAFALAGVVLTFFGFMHGEAAGIAVPPTVAVAYGNVAAFLFALSRYPALAPALTGPRNPCGMTGIVPARRGRLRRSFCIAAKPDFVGLGLTRGR